VESKARGVWGGIHLSQSLQFGSQEPSFPVQVIPVKSQELSVYLSNLSAPKREITRSLAFTEEVTEMLKQLRNMSVRIRAASDTLLRYFVKHPRLIKTTLDLAIIAREKLPDAKLYLEIDLDPETDEEHIVLYARFARYDQETVPRIRKARKAFLSRLGDEPDWPLLTTDFRSPQEVE